MCNRFPQTYRNINLSRRVKLYANHTNLEYFSLLLQFKQCNNEMIYYVKHQMTNLCEMEHLDCTEFKPHNKHNFTKDIISIIGYSNIKYTKVR